MDRKQLIKELQMKFETKAKYLGVPSCAYEITIQETIYIINMQGKIKTSTGLEIDAQELLNKKIKTEPEPELESELNSNYESADLEKICYELKLPMQGHDAKTLTNLINMTYSKQPLIKKALGITEEIFTEEFIQEINETSMKVLEEFQVALVKTKNFRVQAISFDFDEKTLTLKLDLNPEKKDAAINLLSLINKNALTQNYASFKVKQTTNEKYTFRTWLLRLGMIGDEYKNVRKELLSDLKGNAAFKDPNKVGDDDET